MGTTVERICNQALARIGVSDFITDIVEETPEAAACLSIYDNVRDLVLASFPWRFATKRATLASPSGVERDGWDHVYTLPSDFLELVLIAPENRNPVPTSRAAFATEMNDAGDGLLLLTDDADGNISYISNDVEPIVYSPHFADALSWLLASELALTLAGVKEGLSNAAAVKYKMSLSQAASRDGNAGYEPEPESALITIRS
jgi:hypothetical protein